MIKIKVNSSKIYTKLCVFDFDGTLFNSPEKPPNHKGNWWIEKISLEPPNVPSVPDLNFWNVEILNKAKQCCKDPNTYCILLTGRVGKFFDKRIKQLLAQQNLKFDYVNFNEFGKDAGEFKIKEINNILANNKKINQLEIWEDKEEHIELFNNEFSKRIKLFVYNVATEG